MGRETGKPIAQVARELGSSDAQGERQEQIWISATTLSTAAGSATNRRSDRRACRAGADMTIRVTVAGCVCRECRDHQRKRMARNRG
jgi:hypothetical protein